MNVLALLPVEFIIKFLLNKLLGVSTDQWQQAVTWVKEAESKFPLQGSGAQKKAYVLAKLNELLGDAKSHVIDWLFGAAVAFAKSKGWA